MDNTVLSAAEVLRGVDQTTRDASALPGPWYTCEAHAHLESKALFATSWVCVGFIHELANPGDVVPVQVGDYPLFLTRSDDGEIHAYHNVCPHRGFRLVDQARSAQNVIKCPYHAWAFDMRGRLKSTPHWGGYRRHELQGFDASCHGLSAVRCAVWHQWVFVNIDGNAPELEHYIASFAGHLAEYDLNSIVHHRTVPFDIESNWKIVQENFLEVLHLPPVHVRLSEYAPFQDHEVVAVDNCMGTIIETGLPAQWSSDSLPRFSGIEASSQTAKNLALFPNIKIVIGPDHCCSMVELPDGAARTKQRWDFYFVGDGARDERYRPAREAIIDFFVETNEEDAFAVAGLHAGRSSPSYHGGVLSEVWEQGVHHFQKLVAEHMAQTS